MATLTMAQEWSPQGHIQLMDRVGIKRSILSITSPGTHLKVGDFELTKRITRETNHEVAQVSREFPDRFGWFASLPLPDVESSLEEIDHALELGASGFALMTNVEGYYLGDSRFDPVFRKLNQQKTVIFIHPTQCCSLGKPEIDTPLPHYPTPMMEFFFDTTRAVVNLLLTGTVTKFENLTFIVSHCGATLPPLVERISTFSTEILQSSERLSSEEIKELFRSRFLFDLAGMPFPDLIHGYLRVGGPDRLLYGSDYPYTPSKMVESLSQTMDMQLKDMFEETVIQKISFGNAQDLGL